MTKVAVVGLFVGMLACCAVLALEWWGTRGLDAPDHEDDHEWSCAIKSGRCVRSSRDCSIRSEVPNDWCERQSHAACYARRIIITDTREMRCYFTTTRCEAFRDAATRDEEIDSIGACDGYDAASHDRRVERASKALLALCAIGGFWALMEYWSRAARATGASDRAK